LSKSSGTSVHLCRFVARLFRHTMTMQLFEELPALLVMFFCGFLGYMSAEWFKRRAAARAQHRQKLEGICQTKVGFTGVVTAATMDPSDLAACEESMKQSDDQQPHLRTKHRRNKRAARQARKAIRPVAIHDDPPVACDIDMDSSEGTTTSVNLDVRCVAKNMPTAGTSVVDEHSPSVMFKATARGSVQEQGNAPADDGRAAGWECMTMNTDEAEADCEAEAEEACATSIQEAGADDHEQPQGRCADADGVCQQSVLNPEQKLDIQGDGKEESQQVMAHDKSEVGHHVEEQEEDKKKEEQETEIKPEQNKEGEENDKPQGEMNLEEMVGEKEELEQQEMEMLQAAPADDEQCRLRVPELGEWPETTDEEGSMSGHSSQSQQEDDNLSREEERRRVLTGDWAEAQDDEDWSESGHEAMHHSYLHSLDSLDRSTSQPGALKDAMWSMPIANNQTPTPQWNDSCSGSWLDSDNWMTPFATADGEMAGWFTDDKWFGKGQSGSQQLESDCWMTPFDELIQRTTPHAVTASDDSTAPSMNSPIGSVVCIWKAGSNAASEAGGHSSEGVGAEGIFTDGQQVFQPVPSATGQPLFTDGKQLYASVCVVVGPPEEAVDPTLGKAYDAPSSSPCSSSCFMADCSDEDEPSCADIGGARD